MKLHAILEGRTNPAKNTKIGIIAELVSFAEQNGQDDFYVHFTNIEKIGVNPSPSYSGTPSGVYAYPLKYVIHKITDSHERPIEVMPYAGEYKYAYVISVTGTTISLQDKTLCKAAVGHIMDFVGEHAGELTKIINNGSPSDTHMSQLCKMDANGEFVNPGGALYALPYLIYADMEKHDTKETLVRWNKLYSMIGVSGLVDWSKSANSAIIHINEPTQAVFFDVKNIKIHKAFINNTHPSNMPNRGGKTYKAERAAARSKNAGARKAFSRSVCDQIAVSHINLILDEMQPVYTRFMQSEEIRYDGKVSPDLVRAHLLSEFETSFFIKCLNDTDKKFGFLDKLDRIGNSNINSKLCTPQSFFRIELIQEIVKYSKDGVHDFSRTIKKLICDALKSKVSGGLFGIIKRHHTGLGPIFSKSELGRLKTSSDLLRFLDNVQIDDENVESFIKAFGKNRLVDFISDMSNYDHSKPTIKLITHTILGVDQ